MDFEEKMMLVVLGVVLLFALAGLALVLKGGSVTGQAFAYSVAEGEAFAVTERLAGRELLNTLLYKCSSPFAGKEEGELQKAAYAFDSRTKSWLEDEYGFTCEELSWDLPQFK
ncbi:hypothetical protein HYV79_03860 [Candidatus Woesearchaeota archaeon]|nr:hypothetical protein [Candidatus Woesearchaeota archaeon]